MDPERMYNFIRKFILIGSAFLLLVPAYADLDQTVRKKSRLAAGSEGWIEGFGRYLSGEWITYNSVRGDINRALLTRTTTGNKTIIWETHPVPVRADAKKVTFLWMAGMDLNRGPFDFTLYINDIPRFTFSNQQQNEWSVKGLDEGVLNFLALKKDQHGDGFGYMWMTVPFEWCEPGKPLELKIVGSAMNSTTWYMTFEAPDALEYLQEEARYEGWISLIPETNQDQLTLKIQSSLIWAHQELHLNIQGRDLETMILIPDNTLAEGQLVLDSEIMGPDKSIRLFIGDRFVAELPGLFVPISEAQLRDETVVLIRAGQESGNTWPVEISIFYRPNLINKLRLLSDSPIADGTIYLMNSSHQDIAWMDSPEKSIIERDTMLLSPLIEKALQDPGYRFDIEDVLMVEEYLDRHPEKKPIIHQLLLDGKISIGASYSMPYEDMYSGESLIRQFYLGKRWIEKEFPGYTSDTYWNVDVPGRTLQMPQILKKSGVTNLVLSRQKSGVYRWYSPDGSYINVFSPGHYSLAYPALNRDFFDAAFFMADYSLQWEDILDSNGRSAIPVLSDWDMSPAKDYSSFIQGWESINVYFDSEGKKQNLILPRFQLSLATDYFKSLAHTEENKPLTGERPDVWLYIHGPSHHKALQASREADRLLPLAETFATILSLLEGHFNNYPQLVLEKAWRQKIYPDHGWGGKHGDMTDALFLSKFEKSYQSGKQILDRSLNHIGSMVHTGKKKGIPVIVFNGLSWQRSDPVTVDFQFEPGTTHSLSIHDAIGNKIPYQVTKRSTYQDNSWESVELEFIADQVPSLGYKTYYMVPSGKPGSPACENTGMVSAIENRFYKLEPGNGGLQQIYDKQLGLAILDHKNYRGGEIITMTSTGNGAGEFADIQQPDPSDMDQTGHYETSWEIRNEGSVFTSIGYRQPLEHAVVQQTIKLYREIKRIEFETDLLSWDGTLFKEFRETFPLDMDEPEVSYEVPFGVVTVGKNEIQEAAGERYTTPCSEIHPRSIQNWISASDHRFGVTLSSSVVAWDYLDLKDPGGPENSLQAILLASRRSCHGEGNEYLQTGHHSFRFVMTSHEPGWNQGYRLALQANHPLMAVVDPLQSRDARLPETLSFFSIENDHMVISTIKKSESGDGFIVRWNETEGRSGQMKLHSYFPVAEAIQTNLIEESTQTVPVEKNIISIPSEANGIETMKIIPFKND